MTAAQRATLERDLACCMNSQRLLNDPEAFAEIVDALRAALGTCGTCAHADTDNSGPDWAWCAADGDYVVFPFKHKAMPLGERCTGWTAKEEA